MLTERRKNDLSLPSFLEKNGVIKLTIPVRTVEINKKFGKANMVITTIFSLNLTRS